MLTPCILLSCLLSSTDGNSRLGTSSGLCLTLIHACTTCFPHRAIPILLPDSELPADFRHWLLEQKISVFYKFWSPKLPINLVQCKVMFTLVCTVSSTTVFERLFMCLLSAYYVLISFSHGYSAILAAKLIIKLELR